MANDFVCMLNKVVSFVKLQEKEKYIGFRTIGNNWQENNAKAI